MDYPPIEGGLESRDTHSRFTLQKTEMNPGLMDLLACMQTLGNPQLYSPGWGLTGLLLGGVDIGEGPRELFIGCDDTLAALLTTAGLLLY